jgi:transglutaminase-like putative cysteine protease
MLIRAGYDLHFSAEQPVPLLAMLSIHPSRNKDLITPHRIVAEPDMPLYDYVDMFGNICSRITVPPGRLSLSCDFVIHDHGNPDRTCPGAPWAPTETLPDDVMVYLLASRYCQTDIMLDTAWALFGSLEAGWATVEAIVEFTHNHVKFGYEHARPTKSAWDTFQEAEGVCRDFAHLAITFCRCMNIPARYCTGYLGDIGVPPDTAAMDFSAWFEAYLGGEWFTFDARHNTQRIGRIVMAHGRDAIDTALTTTFKPVSLTHFAVHTDEVASTELAPRPILPASECAEIGAN